jgi:uncharacterized membrane protein YqgA involved in biofilm formation
LYQVLRFAVSSTNFIIDRMIGVAINAAGILIGGIVGLRRKQPMSPADESLFKIVLALGTIVIGLSLTWRSLNGGFTGILKGLGIVILAMVLGKLLGRLLHLQKLSNYLGKRASDQLATAKPGGSNFNNALAVPALLACASPLAVLASVHEGLSGFSFAFVVKAVMDGLAAMTFVSVFGWGVLLSIIPVVAYQGTLILLVRWIEPVLRQRELIDSINATNGLLIFCVALVILNLKKIELADYLPSLAIAPLLTLAFR